MFLCVRVMGIIVTAVLVSCDIASSPRGDATIAREIMLQVHDEVTYMNDPDDIWQRPADTKRMGTGDCEDYAILMMTRLHDCGIDSCLVYAYSLKRECAHAVVVLRSEETTGPWYDPTYGDTTSLVDEQYVIIYWLTYDQTMAVVRWKN